MKKYLSLDNQGFAIIGALMALLILTAVGALVFTLSTQDIRVSTRVVGEKKAFSAAQAGIHRLVEASNANQGHIANYTATNIQVDPGGDTTSRYSIGASAIANVPPADRHKPGCDTASEWKEKITSRGVTGENTRYNSSVTIDAGIGYGCVYMGTGYQ